MKHNRSLHPGQKKRKVWATWKHLGGALAHWIVIKDDIIDNYQAVVPSTWNAGPRETKGQTGPYEAALA